MPDTFFYLFASAALISGALVIFMAVRIMLAEPLARPLRAWYIYAGTSLLVLVVAALLCRFDSPKPTSMLIVTLVGAAAVGDVMFTSA